MNTALALPGIAAPLRRSADQLGAASANAVGPLKGLTLAQAEQCLDWLQNHGYTGCKARPEGDLWTVLLEAVPPLPAR